MEDMPYGSTISVRVNYQWLRINFIGKRLLGMLLLAQALCGIRVLLGLLRGSSGHGIVAAPSSDLDNQQVTVLIPVLNERQRLAPCLEGAIAQGPEVREIVVIDGGSVDGTQDLVSTFAQRDQRVRLLEASPIQQDWNGKAWGLEVGLRASNAASSWLLMLDADVRPAPDLTASLLHHARTSLLPALSVATKQDLAGLGEGFIHPSLLATLVYRLGPPNRAYSRVHEVQANGQCFLARRDVLLRCEAFAAARSSRCEDVTVARCLVAAGYAVGFYEAGELVATRMYEGWQETWQNWPRSLPLQDHYTRLPSTLGLIEILLVQGLPLPLLCALGRLPRLPGRGLALALNAVLVCVRFGVLAGMARAYRKRPWTYWFSPICDMAVAILLIMSAMQRHHVWRGRVLVGGLPCV